MQLCQHYPHKSINYCHTLLLIRILAQLVQCSVTFPLLHSLYCKHPQADGYSAYTKEYLNHPHQ